MREFPVRRMSILLLQALVILIGISALVVLIRFPLTEGRAANLNLISIYLDPFILYGYATSLAFFIGLYKTYYLLSSFRQNKIFASKSVQYLRHIKYCAIAFSILIGAAGVYIRIAHNKEDDPVGFLALCMVTIVASIAVAAFAAKFQKKLQHDVDKKAEEGL